MQGSEKRHVDNTSWFLPTGLTIRQKGAKQSGGALIRFSLISLRRGCFTSAVIFRHRPWTAPPITTH
jgi:hypothetical protein